jgi:putative radical SAM enzyme (TIGR03279 family)
VDAKKGTRSLSLCPAAGIGEIIKAELSQAMKEYRGFVIDKVSPGSPAAIAGIKTGWKLLRIDNRAIKDIIDFRILEADDSLRLLLLTDGGILRRVRVEKKASTPLGISFDPPTMADLQHCGNRCLFCFVDQNPKGMRPSLYVKDDDYRLSFLYGNFITLNRLTEKEIERIIKLQLSPLYVSVHSTDSFLRSKMFATKKAARGLRNLSRLIRAGIRIHAQVVICPGLNDGRELERTLNDLGKLGPNLLSVAIVPVGLTRHRSGLWPLRKLTEIEAGDLLTLLESRQKKFLENRGSRFVFAADEIYLMAGACLPEDPEYEGYPQLENGVGLARQFLNELEQVKQMLQMEMPRRLSYLLAGGKSVLPLLEKLRAVFSKVENLELTVQTVENHFFGCEVTVSGLLTGSDLLTALKGKKAVDGVFISNALLKDGSNLFLDGFTLLEVEQELGFPVYPLSGPLEMFELLRFIALKGINDTERRLS